MTLGWDFRLAGTALVVVAYVLRYAIFILRNAPGVLAISTWESGLLPAHSF